MAEVYDSDVAQALDDPDWIKEMTDCDLVLLSKDKSIRTDHVETVIATGARLFLLPDQKHPAKVMIERYVSARYKIAMRAKKPGPFIFMVGPNKRVDPWPLPVSGAGATDALAA